MSLAIVYSRTSNGLEAPLVSVEGLSRISVSEQTTLN